MDIQYWYPVKVKYYQSATHDKWIRETFGLANWYCEVLTYYFEKEEHAILFALHWS